MSKDIIKKTTDQGAPSMAGSAGELTQRSDAPIVSHGVSSANAIAAFKDKLASLPAIEVPRKAGQGGDGKPRLIFAMDATESRKDTWDMAMKLQGDMIAAAGEEGLAVALGFYRGHDECKITGKYLTDAAAVTNLMGTVSPRGGATQIDKLFSGFLGHAEKYGTRGAVFVGDAFEEERSIDSIMRKAAELKQQGFRVFMFQEGRDSSVTARFKDIAEATGGLSAQFDAGAADQLRDLMRTVAGYAAQSPQRPALTSGSKQALAFQRAVAALPAPDKGIK